MAFLGTINVSRETNLRLGCYSDMLRKWSKSINLVSKRSLDDMWSRHFKDSAQLYNLVPHPVKIWADFGSGAGFPGLVVAIMAMEKGSPENVMLMESDSRKCEFMRSVIRKTGAKAQIVNDRVEHVMPLNADVVSARALSELQMLLKYASMHLKPSGVAIFPKGENWHEEVTRAKSAWHFRHQAVKSDISGGGVILKIKDISIEQIF
ncbi:MAG: 16S rRNA (guanine(527)-N(7))-methyltransferase RsmG [Roseovarius sp.]|nr:16S rRNA (guanine(527)-N(7))-methyltransferase RsmG [Roseovarius sp.]